MFASDLDAGPTPVRRTNGAAAGRWVMPFAAGGRELRELLGGTGANVAEMTHVLGAGRAPPGFTITTSACVAYTRAGRREPEGLDAEIAAALSALEAQAGKRLGEPGDPLLVSVRSGRASRCRG
jgi:pyruvate,orthophosphate dikinase